MDYINPIQLGDDDNVSREPICIGGKNRILTIQKGYYDDTIYIGTETNYCARVYAFHRDEPYPFEPMAVLEVFYNDDDCIVDNPFESDTEPGLVIPFLVKLLKEHYPIITKLELHDWALRQPERGYAVRLYALYYLLYGTSWYHLQHGAYIEPEEAKIFTEKNDNFQRLKLKMDWNHAVAYMKDLSDNCTREELQRMYELSPTWQHFFQCVKDRIGMTAMCEFIDVDIEFGLLERMKYNFKLPVHYIDVQTYI